MSTISLNYYGGSGGFFALWVLILGSDYECVFEEDKSTTMDKHWDIKDRWKSSECWPDNDATEKSNINNKVLFVCSPTDDEWDNNPNPQILIYTDFDTHMALAEFKHAFVFNKPYWLKEHADRCFNIMYNNIKDKSWPDVTGFDDYSTLPEYIQEELDINPETYIDDAMNSMNVNGLWCGVPDKLITADLAVDLKDIIRTEGAALLEPLGYKTTDKVRDFVKFWLDKHPIWLQEKLQ